MTKILWEKKYYMELTRDAKFVWGKLDSSKEFREELTESDIEDINEFSQKATSQLKRAEYKTMLLETKENKHRYRPELIDKTVETIIEYAFEDIVDEDTRKFMRRLHEFGEDLFATDIAIRTEQVIAELLSDKSTPQCVADDIVKKGR